MGKSDLQIYSGCAGWSYLDWKGPFYPESLKPDKHLSYYAKNFDFTEINSSFYHIPPLSSVNSWDSATPPNFKFSVKVWKKITHDTVENDLESNVRAFFAAFTPLYPKIKGFLLQFPPKFRYCNSNISKLKYIFSLLPKTLQFFLEVRDQAWYSGELIHFIRSQNNICLVTSYLDKISPFFLRDQKCYYIRMIKNHELTNFSHVQRDQSEDFNSLVANVDELRQNPKVSDIFVIFNNHFSGFSPEDVVSFRKRLGLPYKVFSPQRRLDSFFF